MIQIKNNIYIDETHLSFVATRSSGPGGQHVNKVSSKIILSCPMSQIQGLSAGQLKLLKEGLKSYIVAKDIIKIESQKHRSQFANKQDCIEKLALLVQRALKEKKPRKKTKIPKAVKEKRLLEKKKRAQLKKARKATEE